MTVREEREVRAPPAMALAALGTAGENLGLRVRDARARDGLVLMMTRPRLQGVSLGFIVSARARRLGEATHLAIDVTPVFGSWARRSADQLLSDLVGEFQVVMSAPHARIRSPRRIAPGRPPFGALPRVLGGAWAASALAFFGLVGGGWWWLPAALGALGGVALFAPRPEPWWSQAMTVLVVLSVPFGLLGAVGRRLARANLYWSHPREA